MESLFALGGVIVGAVATIIAAHLQANRQARATERAALWQARLESYGAVWAELKVLPRNPDTPPSQAELRDLVNSLSEWYFGPGGLIMSTRLRAAYFDLTRLLNFAATSPPDKEVSMEKLYEASRSFRHLLSQDLKSSLPESRANDRLDETVGTK
jgi:hypothetical protein